MRPHLLPFALAVAAAAAAAAADGCHNVPAAGTGPAGAAAGTGGQAGGTPVPRDQNAGQRNNPRSRTRKQGSRGSGTSTDSAWVADSIVRAFNLRDSLVRDSIARDSMGRRSTVHDTTARDSTARDSTGGTGRAGVPPG
jgi:hypothetical protein